MSSHRPPTIDPQAAQRWAAHLPEASPWLHEEVARRMEERLQWVLATPATWLHWAPLQGGRQIHESLVRRYPKTKTYVRDWAGAWWTIWR